jgi:outer membrane biogenesis lipoprotein LolB
VPDAGGRIVTLLQDGWQMSFDRYHQVGSAWHPQRIRAVRDGIQLRLVVDAWVPGNARGG